MRKILTGILALSFLHATQSQVIFKNNLKKIDFCEDVQCDDGFICLNGACQQDQWNAGSNDYSLGATLPQGFQHDYTSNIPAQYLHMYDLSGNSNSHHEQVYQEQPVIQSSQPQVQVEPEVHINVQPQLMMGRPLLNQYLQTEPQPVHESSYQPLFEVQHVQQQHQTSHQQYMQQQPQVHQQEYIQQQPQVHHQQHIQQQPEVQQQLKQQQTQLVNQQLSEEQLLNSINFDGLNLQMPEQDHHSNDSN